MATRVAPRDKTKTAAPAETSRPATASKPLRSPAFRKVLATALMGCVLLWASFPPLGLWPLAWLAPMPWLLLIAQPQPLGRSGYWAVWLASFLFWAALLQGIRLAHPALYPGWLVLSAYVAVYLPLFVGMTRMLLHRWHWPLAVAAPLVWVGLEYVRAYMVTGFSLAMLSQSQTPVPLLLQTADLAGAYGPSFVMMLVAAAMAIWFLPVTSRERIASSVGAVVLLVATVAYGAYRLNEDLADGPTARVMLVQGSVDTVLDGNPNRPREMIAHYRTLTYENLNKHPPCDLVVWPESAFALPDLDVADPGDIPEQLDYAGYQSWLSPQLAEFAEQLNAREPGRTSFLAGTSTQRFFPGGDEILNSAILMNPQGEISFRYYKTHLVMFGEYIPFGEWAPWLYSWTPLRPLARGREYKSFEVAGLTFAPNICFESTVPQLVRRQVNQLAAAGQEPDVLVNTTNDGWFYGSAILDLHFQCAVLRAIENRKPYLIAANTGVSGVIDDNGRVLQRGPNRATDVLVAEVRADGRTSLFRTLGDWPAAACFGVTAVVALLGFRNANEQD